MGTSRRWIVRVALAAVAAWALFVSLVDERLEPGLEEFVQAARRVIPDHEDGAVALSGLTAPRGVDVVAHGRFVTETLREATYVSRIPWAETQRIIEIPGSLRFTAGTSELYCWLDPEAFRDRGSCATEERVRELLAENAELVSRYRRVFEMPEFGRMGYNGALVIGLNRLLYAEIVLALRAKRGAEAFAKWHPNQAFLARALRGSSTWVEKAILLVCQGSSLAALEGILRHEPALARRHQEEIRTLLRPRGLAAYNLRGMMHAEYGLLDPLFTSGSRLKFWVHPNFWRNRFYRYAKDFEKVERTPYAELSAFGQRLARSHVEGGSGDYFIDPLNAMFVRTLLSGQPKTMELVKQMHLLEAQKALLLVRAEIAIRGIPDGEIPAFLESARPDLPDPSPGNAIRWDAKERRIYFELPGSEGIRGVRL